MFLIDYTMTNINHFRITGIIISALMVKSWKAENMLDVLMEDANHGDDGFIAGM